jgi:uncharacterized protein
MRSVLLFAGVLLALYLTWLALLFAGQRGIMFPGTGIGGQIDALPLPPGGRHVAVPASFGTVRAVWLAAAAPAPAPALLYFHGNAELVAHNIGLLQPVAGLGMHVLLVEYPGYAGSDGVPGRDSLDEAARVAFDWLVRQPDVDPQRVLAMGRSIGSGPATALAAERPLAALVLLSGFSSLSQLAAGLGAPGVLLRDRWDNRAALSGFAAPLLLFHGRRDTIIPFAHASQLAEVVPQAQLVALDCGHNDCPYFDPAFTATLAAFLRDADVLGSTSR